jgi:AcrR family transcriptional regulator
MATLVDEVTSDTKERLLDVAERLFAEHGFDAVSLRAITAEAGANIAAVNYYFGSKEALIGAVVARLVEPVNRKRIELLDAIKGDGQCDAREITMAFLDPVLEASARGVGGDNRFFKLMSRCMAARDERVSKLVMRQFPEVVARFVEIICECCPGVSSNTAHLRLLFMAGAMAHSLFHHDKLAIVSQGRCSLPTFEVLREEMVIFLAAGLAAQGGGEYQQR